MTWTRKRAGEVTSPWRLQASQTTPEEALPRPLQGLCPYPEGRENRRRLLPKRAREALGTKRLTLAVPLLAENNCLKKCESASHSGIGTLSAKQQCGAHKSHLNSQLKTKTLLTTKPYRNQEYNNVIIYISQKLNNTYIPIYTL